MKENKTLLDRIVQLEQQIKDLQTSITDINKGTTEKYIPPTSFGGGQEERTTIKPLDTKTIISLAKETKAIVTAEDHQISGGMGSAVAECLSQNYIVPIEFIGVNDKFGQSGTPEELEKNYEMDIQSIMNKVEKVLKRKI